MKVQGLSDSFTFNFCVLISCNSLTDHLYGSFGVSCILLKLETNKSHCACCSEVEMDKNSLNLDDIVQMGFF